MGNEREIRFRRRRLPPPRNQQQVRLSAEGELPWVDGRFLRGTDFLKKLPDLLTWLL